jgi:hypothetical protein
MWQKNEFLDNFRSQGFGSKSWKEDVKKENNQARDIQNRSTKEKAILQGKDLVD